MSRLKIITIIGLLLIISGCVKHFVLIKPERVAASKAYTVEPQIPWSGMSFPEEQRAVWTVNGIPLDRILFVNAIEDGKPVLDEDSSLKFKKDMNTIELAELASDSFQTSGKWPQLNMTKLRPQKFGPYAGFAFDMDTTSKGVGRRLRRRHAS